MGDVREELVDRALVFRIECERGRAGGSDRLGERVWNRCPSQPAGVRNDTENPRAGRAPGGAAGRRDGERHPCEHENLRQARGDSAHTEDRVPEKDDTCVDSKGSARFQRSSVPAQRAEAGLERGDRAAETAGIALQPGQLPVEIRRLARDVARVELRRRSRREIRVERLQLARDARSGGGEDAGTGGDRGAVSARGCGIGADPCAGAGESLLLRGG